MPLPATWDHVLGDGLGPIFVLTSPRARSLGCCCASRGRLAVFWGPAKFSGKPSPELAKPIYEVVLGQLRGKTQQHGSHHFQDGEGRDARSRALFVRTSKARRGTAPIRWWSGSERGSRNQRCLALLGDAMSRRTGSTSMRSASSLAFSWSSPGPIRQEVREDLRHKNFTQEPNRFPPTRTQLAPVTTGLFATSTCVPREGRFATTERGSRPRCRAAKRNRPLPSSK